jgi:hypothetical protein
MSEAARQDAAADSQVNDAEPIVEDAEPDVAVDVGDQRLGSGRDDAAPADDKDTGGTEAQRVSRGKQRRMAQRRYQEQLRADNERLQAQVEQLSRGQQEIVARLSGTEGATLETQLADVDSKLQQATLIMSRAARSDAPTAEQDLAEAITIRDQLLEAKRNLTLARQYQHQRAQQPQREAQQAPPRGTAPKDRYIARFVAENADWYDPRLGNRESKIADRISAMLDAEGEHDPNSKEYWDEFNRRVHDHPGLAHLFEGSGEDDDGDDEDAPPPRRSAPPVNGHTAAPGRAGGGPRLTVAGRERPLKRGEVRIPRELREGMEEAGIWSNKEARNRVIADYQRNLRSQNSK